MFYFCRFGPVPLHTALIREFAAADVEKKQPAAAIDRKGGIKADTLPGGVSVQPAPGGVGKRSLRADRHARQKQIICNERYALHAHLCAATNSRGKHEFCVGVLMAWRVSVPNRAEIAATLYEYSLVPRERIPHQCAGADRQPVLHPIAFAVERNLPVRNEVNLPERLNVLYLNAADCAVAAVLPFELPINQRASVAGLARCSNDRGQKYNRC